MDETTDPLPRPDDLERFAHGDALVDYVPHEVLVDVDDEPAARRILRNIDVNVDDEQELDARLRTVRLRVADRIGGRRLHAVVADVHARAPRLRIELVHWLHASSHIHVWPGALAIGLDRELPQPTGNAGEGARVAVLDTGVAAHPWFGRSRHPSSDREIPPEVTVEGATMLSPVYGHGTFVAGVVHRTAPGATIIGRQLPLDGSMCRSDRVAEAVLQLVDDRPDVVNLSWGSYAMREGTLVVERAVNALMDALPGTVVVAAAGNDGVNVPTWPAALERVVAVGANGPDGRRAQVRHPEWRDPFEHWASNFGPWVDKWALGVDVEGPYPPVPGPPIPSYDGASSTQFARGFARWGGTSFSAPVIAGEIAGGTPEAGSAREALRRILERDAIDLRETPV